MRHETNWDEVCRVRLHDVWRTRAGKFHRVILLEAWNGSDVPM